MPNGFIFHYILLFQLYICTGQYPRKRVPTGLPCHRRHTAHQGPIRGTADVLVPGRGPSLGPSDTRSGTLV